MVRFDLSSVDESLETGLHSSMVGSQQRQVVTSEQTSGASGKHKVGKLKGFASVSSLVGDQEVLPQAPDSFPPLRDEAAVRVLKGRMKGIQGHCNSCYMDAALFR